MKKNELKKILKPLIKECIKEVIFEDGTLSGIISEVAQGLSTVQSTVPQQIREKKVIKSNQPSEALIQAKKDLEETKKSLRNSTGLDGIFEGISPLPRGGSSQASQHGALRDRDPNDAGVDISGIMKIAGNAWEQLK